MNNLKLPKIRWKLSSQKIKQKEKLEMKDRKLEDRRVKSYSGLMEKLFQKIFFYFWKFYFCLYFTLHVHSINLIPFLLEREIKHLCPVLDRCDDLILIISPGVSFTNEEIKMARYTLCGHLHIDLKT